MVTIKLEFSTVKNAIREYIINLATPIDPPDMVEGWNMVLLGLDDCKNMFDVTAIIKHYIPHDWEDMYWLLVDILVQSSPEDKLI